MLEIAGAIYFEQCDEGSWNEYYGSGLRAAVSLKGYIDCQLRAYLSHGEAESVKIVASVHGIKLILTDRNDPISFRYEHGLSVPTISPPIQLIRRSSTLIVEAEHSLRFGMLEGDAIVHGDLVVYDPQSAFAPDPFTKNGSTAKRLCIVCNRREAMLMANAHDLNEAIFRIADQDSAEAVIVKCGSEGALVLDSSRKLHHVPAFCTPFIWPIGSGDVFAAWYAFEWALCGVSPFDAAYLASKATAQYCATKSLGNLNPNDPSFSYLPLAEGKPRSHVFDIYLAGPFFNMSQRWQILQSKAALEDMGLKVFSPLHDVGISTHNEIYPADIEGLKQSKLVYAVLDGCDPGTVYEIGFAAALEKPIVGFSQNETEEHMKMLKGTPAFILFDDFVSSIYHAAWRARE